MLHQAVPVGDLKIKDGAHDDKRAPACLLKGYILASKSYMFKTQAEINR